MVAASSTTLLLVASLFMLTFLTPAASAGALYIFGPISVCPYEGTGVGVIYAGAGGAGFKVVFDGSCVLVEHGPTCMSSCDGVEPAP